MGISRENLAYIFLFLEKEKKHETILKNKKTKMFAWAQTTLKQNYFTIGIQSGKSGIHVVVFPEKDRKTNTFWNKIKKTNHGPKTPEKVIFYIVNSTGKIWYAFSCFRGKKGKMKLVWLTIKHFRLGPKSNEKCYFTIGIQQGKYCMHFLAFGENKRKSSTFDKQNLFSVGQK